MSRPRVITGTDERGRPKAAWADAEPDTSRGYGHMEPESGSAVERRQATPEELAAARARESEPSHLTSDNSRTRPFGALSPTDAERMQASRQRGAVRHVEVVTGRKAPKPKEEPAVSEPAQDVTTQTLAAVRGDGPWDGLSVLADAVVEAIDARDEWTAANRRWTEARIALDAAYRALDEPTETAPAVAPRRGVRIQHYNGAGEPISTDQAIVGLASAAIDRSTSRVGEGQRPGQAAARDRRAAAVMAAMERLDDNMGAVAAELGMKKNAVSQIVKFARRRAGAQS